MDSNFLNFLEKTTSVAAKKAAKNAKQMELLFFTDVNSSMGKARLFIEELIIDIFNLEKFDTYIYETKNLSERIHYLYKQEIIDTPIKDAFNFIRRLGNDAVHESKSVDMQDAYAVHKSMFTIAKWFVELYTTDDVSLMDYEPPSPPKMTEDLIEEKIRILLEEINKKQNIEKSVEVLTVSEHAEIRKQAENQLLEFLKEPSENYLLKEVSKLKISSAEAVENAASFSAFKNYLHVDRPIQIKLEEILKQRVIQSEGNLILLCGSVGDGKSHLLAYLNNKYPEIMSQYKIFNDATESFSPSKTALQTLEELLLSFSDQNLANSNEKIIIAINMGILSNFISMKHEQYTYNALKQFVEDSGIFSSQIMTHEQKDSFDLISFADYQMFELTPNGVESAYFANLLNKICLKNEKNPFYAAYKKDLESGQSSIVHENFEFLCNEQVQQQIVQLLIEVMIKYKHSISSRHFLSFVADILIPSDFTENIVYSDLEKLNNTLPNILFNTKNRSKLLDLINELNPIHARVQVIDELLVKLNTLQNWSNLIETEINCEVGKRWLKPFVTDASEDLNVVLIIQLIGSMYLSNQHFIKQSEDEVYNLFLEYLYAFNKNDKAKKRVFFRRLTEIIFCWKGKTNNNFINLRRLRNETIISQFLRIQFKIESDLEPTDIKLNSFKTGLQIVALGENKKIHAAIDIDYSLFVLLEKVERGYRPNKKDEEDATAFVEFIDKLMELGNKREELVVDYVAESKQYRLVIDEYDDSRFVFERIDN